jgi:glucosamine kinase
MQSTEVVIGIDGGGTHTRVIAADSEGNVLACSKKGDASAYRNSAAQHNVRSAIMGQQTVQSDNAAAPA